MLIYNICFSFSDISLCITGSATSLQLTQMTMFTFDSHWNSFAFIGRSLGQRWARLSLHETARDGQGFPWMKQPSAWPWSQSGSLTGAQNSRRLGGCLCGPVSGPGRWAVPGVRPVTSSHLSGGPPVQMCVCVSRKGDFRIQTIFFFLFFKKNFF